MTEKRKTVLVVDDEPDVQVYLRTILEDAGFDVMVAGNGKQALDRCQERKPDAISLDLVMPKMSGLKFYRYIKKNKDRRGIPIIVVTAHGRDEFGNKDLEKLRKEGEKEGLQFLEKPVKPAAYLEAVRRALGLPQPGEKLDEAEVLRRQVEAKLRGADPEKLEKTLRVLTDQDD